MQRAIENLTKYDGAVIQALSREFQSLWLVDIETKKMFCYKADDAVTIPGSVEIVENLPSYDDSRKWYIQTCVVAEDRLRLMNASSMDMIIKKISSGKPYIVEYTRINGDKLNYNQLFFSKTGIEEDDEKFTHFVLGFRDVDVRKKLEIDALTGVYTRNAFIQRATQMLKDYPTTEYDIVVSDIVDFKQVNEKYGAKMGDRILKAVGNALGKFKADNVIIGRYGGDQFAALIPHEDLSKIIIENDLKLFAKEENLPHVEVKFAVYSKVDHSRAVTTLCDHAHIALNSIKDQYGKVIAVYDDNFRKTLEVQRKIEKNMKEALANEQFKVWYQPKHDASSGKLVGAEALIRWIHPEFGFMSPGDFIPIFEKNGFIVELDDYVRRRTCKNIRRWTDKNINVVPISVNVSKLEFAQENIMERITSALKEASVLPEKIHIEITESLMEDDVNELIRVLTALRNQGFEIELDDFGAGYSSINILGTLPIDVVKLDMSFMKQFDDPKRKMILSACINLGKELGYRTISEGVETQEQLETLKTFGVDSIQGYYFSKPIPEDEFEDYMRQHIG